MSSGDLSVDKGQPIREKQIVAGVTTFNSLEMRVNRQADKIKSIRPGKKEVLRGVREIRIDSHDCQRLEELFAKFLIGLEKSEKLDISEIRRVAGRLSPALENIFPEQVSDIQSISKALLSQDLKDKNIKPRSEERSFQGRVAQLALAMPDGERRKQFLNFIRENAPDLLANYQITEAGSTTLELGVKGIDKATPMRYLRDPEQLLSTLDQTGYRPGFVDVKRDRNFIVADFDGTLAYAPEAGKPTSEYNLSNSPARESIVNYLKAGGLLVINSGNDVDRICERIEKHIPKEYMGNILVGAAGGNFLVGYNAEGHRVEIHGYAEHAASLSTPVPENSCQMVYLGDDKEPNGNDRSGFEIAGKERSICVTTDTKLPEASKAFLERKNLVTGGPEAMASFMDAVVERLSITGGDRIFENMDDLVKAAKVQRGTALYDKTLQLEDKIDILEQFGKEPEHGRLQRDITEKFYKILKRPVPKNSRGEVENLSWLQIRRHAAGHASFLSLVDAEFSKIPPATRGGLKTKATQVKLSAENRALALRARLGLDTSTKLESVFSTFAKHPPVEDAKIIAKSFNQPISVVRKGDTAPPAEACDAWVIMGNNDIRQVDRVYDELMTKWRKDLRENGVKTVENFPHIFISGFGGHGTSAGIIFSQTEADTIRDHLLTRLNEFPDDVRAAIDKKIIAEPNATNSGENVRFLQAKFEQYGRPQNLVISGTPSAVARQMLSFAKQSGYDFNSIQSVSFDENWYEQNYYPEGYEVDSIIHVMCRLREVVGLLQFSISTPFVAPHIFEKKAFSAALEVVFNRYRDITGHEALDPHVYLSEDISKKNAYLFRKKHPNTQEAAMLLDLRRQMLSTFVEKYNSLMQSKLENRPVSKGDEEILKTTVDPISGFSRRIFAELENHYMHKMPIGARLELQRQAMIPRSLRGLLSPTRELPPSKQ